MLFYGLVTVGLAWMQYLKTDTIMVISEDVAKDEFKKIVPLGALPGIKTILLSPEEAIEKVKNEFDGMKVFLIIQYPSEALFLVEKGAKINHINLGTSMVHPGDKIYTIKSVRSNAVPIPEGEFLYGKSCMN